MGNLKDYWDLVKFFWLLGWNKACTDNKTFFAFVVISWVLSYLLSPGSGVDLGFIQELLIWLGLLQIVTVLIGTWHHYGE